MKNERLKELMEQKKNNLVTPLDQKKYQVVDELFKNDDCFFKMKIETAFGILDFLGVKEDETLDLYQELISPEEYKKVVPKQRLGIQTKQNSR